MNWNSQVLWSLGQYGTSQIRIGNHPNSTFLSYTHRCIVNTLSTIPCVCVCMHACACVCVMSYILSIHLVLDIASQCHESLMKMCKHQTQIHSYTTVLNDPYTEYNIYVYVSIEYSGTSLFQRLICMRLGWRGVLNSEVSL